MNNNNQVVVTNLIIISSNAVLKIIVPSNPFLKYFFMEIADEWFLTYESYQHKKLTFRFQIVNYYYFFYLLNMTSYYWKGRYLFSMQ